MKRCEYQCLAAGYSWPLAVGLLDVTLPDLGWVFLPEFLQFLQIPGDYCNSQCLISAVQDFHAGIGVRACAKSWKKLLQYKSVPEPTGQHCQASKIFFLTQQYQ
jgi:hypothetical protein